MAERSRPLAEQTTRRLIYALVAVSVAHAVSPLILRGVHSALGWDETVYVSQIDPHAVAERFTAPRARGLTLLTAPASLLSGSLVVLRVWMAILSGAGMFLAFLPWLRVRRSYVVPFAALMFSGLWVATYYSFEAMPNQYVAYGALAACGWLVMWMRRPDRRRWLGYAATAVAFTALMRPTDSLFLLVPLLAGVVLQRTLSRRTRVIASSLLIAGLLVGFAEWFVEAYVRFGGPLARFHQASAENIGGLHWSLGAQMRVLAGPILCRGTCQATSPMADRIWWFAIPVFVGVGIWAARRHRASAPYLIATGVGLTIAAQYVFAIGYAAPRFLEPTYALLALPAAEAVAWLWRRAGEGGRPVVFASLLVLGAAQGVTQLHLLRVNDHRLAVSATRAELMADYLEDTGVSGPDCFVGGDEAGQIAFLDHCHVLAARIPPAEQLTGDDTAVVIAPDATPPRSAVVSWPAHTLTENSPVRGWTVWRASVLDGQV
ncbi:MAG TPA: hypothetical protein VHC43_07305 [Mycobacteriales bacterium]|nr:hypothetical protein [Mycobacteriales bacterium]